LFFLIVANESESGALLFLFYLQRILPGQRNEAHPLGSGWLLTYSLGGPSALYAQ
jgi:hypothetical protein